MLDKTGGNGVGSDTMNLFGRVACGELEALQPSPEITLRHLAEHCGLSSATVSRALSGHPNVSARVKLLVQDAAQALGYKRNPLVGSLMAQVRGGRTRHFAGNLAIVHVASPQQPEPRPVQRRMIEAAEMRAHELGFSLTVFSLRSSARSASALGRVLEAQGVHGVIFLQPHSNNATATFPWEKFTSLQIDYDSPAPVQHTVSLDHHVTLISALHRLRLRGYHRAGLFIERHKDERLVHKWSAAFRSFQENQGGIGFVPILSADALSKENFLAWHDAHHPDLLIGHVDRALSWLKPAGIRVPHDVGFFNLNWHESTQPCAGLDLRAELHGIVAVETLAAQVQRNEMGIPADPRTVTFNGRWVDGPTLRPDEDAAPSP